jgi:hypothetical protein
MKLYIIDNKSPSSTFVGMGPTVVILSIIYTSPYIYFPFFNQTIIAMDTADNGRDVDRHYHQIFRLRFLTFYIIIFVVSFIFLEKRVACLSV